MMVIHTSLVVGCVIVGFHVLSLYLGEFFIICWRLVFLHIIVPGHDSTSLCTGALEGLVCHLCAVNFVPCWAVLLPLLYRAVSSLSLLFRKRGRVPVWVGLWWRGSIQFTNTFKSVKDGNNFGGSSQFAHLWWFSVSVLFPDWVFANTKDGGRRYFRTEIID